MIDQCIPGTIHYNKIVLLPQGGLWWQWEQVAIVGWVPSQGENGHSRETAGVGAFALPGLSAAYHSTVGPACDGETLPASAGCIPEVPTPAWGGRGAKGRWKVPALPEQSCVHLPFSRNAHCPTEMLHKGQRFSFANNTLEHFSVFQSCSCYSQYLKQDTLFVSASSLFLRPVVHFVSSLRLAPIICSWNSQLSRHCYSF